MSGHMSRCGKGDLARDVLAVPDVVCGAVEPDGHAGGGVGHGAARTD